MKIGFKMYSFQADPKEVTLDNQEIRLLVGNKGKDFFSRLKMTKDAKKFLDDNSDLAKVIDKW